jgi:hypothetical protein
MKWSVAIFSSRESLETLSSSINAILNAGAEHAPVIDVMINGNRTLANDVGRRIEALRAVGQAGTCIRAWYIPIADKAHAWNQYIHTIWPSSNIAFFVDGYAEVMPEALRLISDGLRDAPNALAASGIPSVGRTSATQAEIMIREGGLHGNLYAMRGDFVTRLRKTAFRLPLGLYRTDGVLGAAICFALDPAKNDWDSGRILVHPNATWRIRPLSLLSVTDIRSHIKKVMRQAQGVLENLAVREHLAIQKNTPQSLGRTSAELVQSWIRAHPIRALRAAVTNPLCIIAAWRIHRSRDWSEVTIPAQLLVDVICG